MLATVLLPSEPVFCHLCCQQSAIHSASSFPQDGTTFVICTAALLSQEASMLHVAEADPPCHAISTPVTVA